MKRVLFKVIVPTMFIAVWMWTCYLICNKTEGLIVTSNYLAKAWGRERCDREGHAVFLRP